MLKEVLLMIETHNWREARITCEAYCRISCNVVIVKERRHLGKLT